jgi:hypothetical protein
VLSVDVLPYATVEGVAMTVKVAWATLFSVTGRAAEVAEL